MRIFTLYLLAYTAALCTELSDHVRHRITLLSAGPTGILSLSPRTIQLKFIDDDQKAYGASWDLSQCPEGERLWSQIGTLISSAGTNSQQPCSRVEPDITSELRHIQRYLGNNNIVTPIGYYGLSMLTPDLSSKLFPGNKQILWSVGYTDSIFMQNKPGSITINPEKSRYSIFYIPETPEATLQSECRAIKEHLQSLARTLEEQTQQIGEHLQTLSQRMDRLEENSPQIGERLQNFSQRIARLEESSQQPEHTPEGAILDERDGF